MTMATNLGDLISVDSYIKRFIDGGEKPTCEYVDGVLEQKSLTTRKHAQIQMNLVVWIGTHYENQFTPLPEPSTHVSATRFYVPDVAVEDESRPIEGRYPGPDDPVPLCVEVVSPEDRFKKLFEKCEEYHRWGVDYCWVIDPEEKQAWEYHRSAAEPLQVHETLNAGPISIPFTAVFKKV